MISDLKVCTSLLQPEDDDYYQSMEAFNISCKEKCGDVGCANGLLSLQKVHVQMED